MSSPAALRSWIGGRNVATDKLAPLLRLFDANTGAERDVRVQAATEADVSEAVRRAKLAQADWARRAPVERSRVLAGAAGLLRDRNAELAELESTDTGRPLSETLAVDAHSAADCLEYYGGVAPAAGGQALDLPGSGWAYTRREPLGVTCGIGAWNYPLQGAAWKSAPALAFGNAVVFKPSELTPRTALRLAEVYAAAGLPDGLFNVVLGAGGVGEQLATHRDVAKVSFTGSVGTGKKVYAAAAESLKKVTMELGGKSPLIIFDDADIDEAVSGAMIANWYSSGQVCSNGTRVFVHRKLASEFVERLVTRTQKLKIGDPMDPNTQIGPMINEQHMNKVLHYIKQGREEGADLVYGGERPKDDALKDGFFITPAIFTDCSDDMTIVREEIFGMVMSVLIFDDEDEVVERANDSEYGLSAGIFTKDIQRAHRVAHSLQAGTMWINNYNLAPVETPWGGYKHSGLGRENGLAGIEAWTQLKSVYVEMEGVDSPYK